MEPMHQEENENQMPQFREEWKERQLPEGTVLWLTSNQGSQGNKLKEGKKGNRSFRKAVNGKVERGEGELRSGQKERRSFQKPQKKALGNRTKHANQ